MSKKTQSSFVCDNCGSSFQTWLGKCPDCGEWNTLKEFKTSNYKSPLSGNVSKTVFVKLDSVNSDDQVSHTRLVTEFAEVDRVLGGGFVEDGVVLVAGEPGVGKSTLLLSILGKKEGLSSVYVSSEEESNQIAYRAKRLGVSSENIHFSNQKEIDSLLTSLAELVAAEKIKLIIFDSLQGFYCGNNESLPGSISQAKEVLMKIVEFSKKQKVASIVVGHITKEGEIAGPKFLEHMVDVVLFLEGEEMGNMRLLRSFKNRFGPTDEVGFLEITDLGMKEIKNPSAFFLELEDAVAGKATLGARQGQRVVFATVESLVVSTSLAFPKRVAKGIDAKRLELILAILKKYLHLNVDSYDIYVNVSGGLKINDPLADLGVATAIYSSMKNKVYSPKTVFLGELGLLGNIRKSRTLPRIIKEAKRLGFTQIYSSDNLKSIQELGKV